MSKAVLVIDEMPITCLSCPFTLSHICEVEKITVGEIMDGTITRHESCPLRPLPKYLGFKDTETETSHWPFGDNLDRADGYNFCLNEITGETE